MAVVAGICRVAWQEDLIGMSKDLDLMVHNRSSSE
eukprot:SAG31_NODE_17878_length_655_cov_0.821942_2_plen_34_part_01